MRRPVPGVVVGAGPPGTRCAEALRGGGWELPVTVVGAEGVGPYERPALEVAAARRELASAA